MCVVYIVTIQSCNQLLRKEGIQDIPLASNPPMLQSIANKLCEWKQLARFLGLDEPTIKTIEWNYCGNYTELKFQALYTWTRRKGSDATLVNLLQVIYCCLNNRLLVEEIAKIQHNSMLQLLRIIFVMQLCSQTAVHTFSYICIYVFQKLAIVNTKSTNSIRDKGGMKSDLAM